MRFHYFREWLEKDMVFFFQNLNVWRETDEI